MWIATWSIKTQTLSLSLSLSLSVFLLSGWVRGVCARDSVGHTINNRTTTQWSSISNYSLCEWDIWGPKSERPTDCSARLDLAWHNPNNIWPFLLQIKVWSGPYKVHASSSALFLIWSHCFDHSGFGFLMFPPLSLDLRWDLMRFFCRERSDLFLQKEPFHTFQVDVASLTSTLN